MLVLLFALVAVAAGVPIKPATPVSPSREIVSFDYGWRFTLDDPSAETPKCTFSKNLANYTCDISGTALKYTPDGRVWAPDCFQACASRPDCEAWTWQSTPWTASCYISFDKNIDCSPATDAEIEFHQQQQEAEKAAKAKGAHGLEQTPWPTKSLVIAGGTEKNCEIPSTYSYAQQQFDDQSWTGVDIPHDSVVNSTYSENEDNNHGSFVRRVVWYRKHFWLPQEWNDGGLSTVQVEFDAIIHVADIWLNGEHLGTFRSGYVPIILNLDRAKFSGQGQSPNVLAIRADTTFGSEHWYAGGGLYRHARLVRTSRVRIAPNGVFSPSEGMTFSPSVSIVNDVADRSLTVYATFTLSPDAAGTAPGSNSTAKILAHSQTSKILIEPNSRLTLKATESVSLPSSVLPWSMEKPIMYSLLVKLWSKGSSSSGKGEENDDVELLDSVVVPVSFRSTKWDANNGFFLNNEHRRLHGFCHHEDFAGVGVAVSDRINLYRAQALRAVGGNSWRMSHNPYKPTTYDILDRLGIVVWDEARDYAGWYVDDMAAMVERDRNHPSIVIWSFCNEIECHQDLNDNSTQLKFHAAAKELDPTRPVSFNWVPESSDIVDTAVDVHGLSHMESNIFNAYHAANPKRPMLSSECCSCETQRGESEKTGGDVFYPGFDGVCLKQQLAWSEDEGYIAGTMGIWTLFDYYGEPGGWPHISSSFGQFDLTGIPKAHAYWYQAWWGCGSNVNCSVVHIVETWDGLRGPDVINVISNAASVKLYFDGSFFGEETIEKLGYASFNVSGAYESMPNGGAVFTTAVGLDSEGNVVGKHTWAASTTSIPARLRLDLDAPHVATGTGSALLLDGHDTALVRVTVLDLFGAMVTAADVQIRFRIVSGAGRIAGVGNGNPSSHEPNQAHVRSTYHGVARAVVQVTTDCVSGNQQLMSEIDVDFGSRTAHCNAAMAQPEDIVVEASVEGMPAIAPVTISIPTSVNPLDGPIAVATTKPDISLFLAHFHEPQPSS